MGARYGGEWAWVCQLRAVRPRGRGLRLLARCSRPNLECFLFELFVVLCLSRGPPTAGWQKGVEADGGVRGGWP
eukprot:scaffold10269_cov102-Isochrysis_galbana.AAC.10